MISQSCLMIPDISWIAFARWNDNIFLDELVRCAGQRFLFLQSFIAIIIKQAKKQFEA